jgi:thiol-disulfide isomerase/thioredoxin
MLASSLAAIAVAFPALAADTSADQAWKELRAAFQPPTPPAAWQTQRPSSEEIAAYRNLQRDGAGKAADKAKEFITRFPDHPYAAEARRYEFDLTQAAVRLGDNSRLGRLEELVAEKLKNPSLSEDERFALRSQAAERKAVSLREQGAEIMLAEYEKQARALQKDFPKRREVFAMLLDVAQQSEREKGRKLAGEILHGDADPQVQQEAAKLLKKLDAVGKPLPIKFTAVDGREVNLAAMKGKVVLLDFWATWCGPCVAELPSVKAVYDKLHEKGFEIIGISLDPQKEPLVKFVADQKMPWPQYFDGKGWENDLAQQYGINSIPAMWLIDKQGNLRDLSARVNLAEKIAKLLAE